MAKDERAFYDSNVLVYTAVDDARSETAVALLGAPFEISVQVLNEFVNVALKKLRYSWDEVEFALRRFETAAQRVHDLTIERQREGVRVARRYKLGIHDATIAATALSTGCTVLFTEDMQDGLVIDGRLTIRNPFSGDR